MSFVPSWFFLFFFLFCSLFLVNLYLFLIFSISGTYAPKTLVYTQFEHWSELEGLETHCEGDCASLKTAWRLLGDDLDSGVGHGNVADSFLTVCLFPFFN